MNDKLQEAFYIKDLTSQRDQLIGLDNLLKNEDCVEEDIFKVKDYITFIIDQRLEETISLLKKRIEIMNKNIKYLKKKFKKDWSLTYDEAIINEDLDENDNNLNIDEILDKINSRGMSSLTKDEKNFLKSRGSDKDGDKDGGKDDKK